MDSRALPCGCLVGVYETYESETVAIIDVKGSACVNPDHRIDAPVNLQPPSTIPTISR
ncbi:MAG: hypothetical protein ND807_01825 [Vicinamibacterales bacterium]|nr:hypothetical protein [Vicinamibacterales bacterium]